MPGPRGYPRSAGQGGVQRDRHNNGGRRLLTEKQLRRAVHKNIQALERDIRSWIAIWNQYPRPFIWTKTADEILERLATYLNRIPDPGH